MNVLEMSVLTLGVIGVYSLINVGTILLPHLGELIYMAKNLLLNTVVARHRFTEDGYRSVVYYIKNHYKTYGFLKDYIFFTKEYVKSQRKERRVFGLYNNFESCIVFIEGVPIFIKRNEEGHLNFYYIKKSFDIESFLVKVAAYYEEYEGIQSEKREKKRGFYHVRRYSTRGSETEEDNKEESITTRLNRALGDEYSKLFSRPFGYDIEDLGKEVDLKLADPLDDIAKNADMEDIIKDIRFWTRHEHWYKDRNITWKRGYLLYGEPGNGKTSLVRAIGQHFDIPIHIFDLSGLNNGAFHRYWESSSKTPQRIVLIEDIDSVFHGREPQGGVELTFDALLEVLDGIDQTGGTLVFITTNKIEYIDPALGAPNEGEMSSRPGRIDKAAFVPKPDAKGKAVIGRRILDNEEDIERLVQENPNDSGAQFQERCIQFALNKLWEKEQ